MKKSAGMGATAMTTDPKRVKVSEDTVQQLMAVLLQAEQVSDACKCLSAQHRANFLGQVLVARNALRSDLVLGGSLQ